MKRIRQKPPAKLSTPTRELGSLDALPTSLIGHVLGFGCMHAWARFRSTCVSARRLTTSNGSASSPHTIDLHNKHRRGWIAAFTDSRQHLRPRCLNLHAIEPELTGAELGVARRLFPSVRDLRAPHTALERKRDAKNLQWLTRDGEKLLSLDLRDVECHFPIGVHAPDLAKLRIKSVYVRDLPSQLVSLHVSCVKSRDVWLAELCAHARAPHLQVLKLDFGLSHAQIHACLSAMPQLLDLSIHVTERGEREQCKCCEQNFNARRSGDSNGPTLAHARLARFSCHVRPASDTHVKHRVRDCLNLELYTSVASLPTLRALSFTATEYLLSGLFDILLQSDSPVTLKSLRVMIIDRDNSDEAPNLADTFEHSLARGSCALKTLEALNVTRSDWRQVTSGALADLSSLEQLTLTFARFDPSFLQTFDSLQHLCVLDLNCAHTSRTQPIRSLPRLTRVHTLHLRNVHLESELVQRLHAHFPAVTRLHVPVCTPDALAFLRGFERLERLDLACCKNDRTLEQIATKSAAEWCALPCMHLSPLALPRLEEMQCFEEVMCVNCESDAAQTLKTDVNDDECGELHGVWIRMLLAIRPTMRWDPYEECMRDLSKCDCA